VDLPISLAHAGTTLTSVVQTGGSGQPGAVSAGWEATYWYPSCGVGIAARLGFGFGLGTEAGDVGLALTDIAAVTYETGVAVSGATSEPFSEVDLRLLVAPLVSYVSPEIAILAGSAQLAGQAGYRDGVLVSLGISYRRGVLSLQLGGGYERGLRLGAGIGVILGGFYLEPAIELRYDELLDTALVGFTLSLAPVPAAQEMPQ
jgi:hypothetical protein